MKFLKIRSSLSDETKKQKKLKVLLKTFKKLSKKLGIEDFISRYL